MMRLLHHDRGRTGQNVRRSGCSSGRDRLSALVRVATGTLLIFSLAFPLHAAVQDGSTNAAAAVSDLTARYRAGLDAYTAGDFGRAARIFEEIVSRDEKDPMTLKARYFLARSQMRLKQWDAASSGLIAIYSISASFFTDWNCDYLLGECRRAQGKD